MSFYDDMQNTVAELLDEFGITVTLTHKTMSHNVSTGVSTPTTSTQTPKGIVKSYREDQIDGTLIKRGDNLVVLDASELTTAPTIDDTITVGSTVYTIVNVDTKEPTDTPLAYMCQSRTA